MNDLQKKNLYFILAVYTYIFHFQTWGKNFDARKKKKRGRKKTKKVGKGEKKSIRGRITTKSYTPGGINIFISPPICTVPTWGKKYHFGKGGGIRI